MKNLFKFIIFLLSFSLMASDRKEDKYIVKDNQINNGLESILQKPLYQHKEDKNSKLLDPYFPDDIKNIISDYVGFELITLYGYDKKRFRFNSLFEFELKRHNVSSSHECLMFNYLNCISQDNGGNNVQYVRTTLHRFIDNYIKLAIYHDRYMGKIEKLLPRVIKFIFNHYCDSSNFSLEIFSSKSDTVKLDLINRAKKLSKKIPILFLNDNKQFYSDILSLMKILFIENSKIDIELQDNKSKMSLIYQDNSLILYLVNGDNKVIKIDFEKDVIENIDNISYEKLNFNNLLNYLIKINLDNIEFLYHLRNVISHNQSPFIMADNKKEILEAELVKLEKSDKLARLKNKVESIMFSKIVGFGLSILFIYSIYYLLTS